MRFWLAGWVLLSAISAAAVEEKSLRRDSSVTAGFNLNPHDEDSYRLSTDLALGERTRLLADYDRDQLSEPTSSTPAMSFSAGLGYDFDRQWYAAINGDYESLPNSVFAKGADISAKYRVHDWRFGLGLKTLRYTSDKSLSGKRLRQEGIPERSGTLDVSYFFSRDWNAYFSGTGYGYGGATPSELEDVLAARPNTSTGLLDAVSGFPKKSGKIGVGYQATEEWNFDLSVTKTTYELYPKSTSSALAIAYQTPEYWEFVCTLTSFRQDGKKTGGLFGLETTYSW